MNPKTFNEAFEDLHEALSILWASIYDALSVRVERFGSLMLWEIWLIVEVILIWIVVIVMALEM